MVNKNGDGQSSVTSKEGKSVFGESDFLSSLEAGLVAKRNKYMVDFKPLLKSSIEGQNRLGQMFALVFSKIKGMPFEKGYLGYPWPHAKTYATLSGMFLYHPAAAAPFIDGVSQYYYWPFLETWRKVQSFSYFPKTSDYCARAVPGTSAKARDKSINESFNYTLELKSKIPKTFQGFISKGTEKFFAKRWASFGGALLPLGYQFGVNGYGRLKSIPPSTMCNMNKKVKSVILRTIKAHHNISFFELDLKGCHARIFEDLFDWTDFNRKDLPPIDDLWPDMIRDFWESANSVQGFDLIKNQISSWPEGHLKGLIKNQFYKALNGGMPDFADDNVERSKTKLKIKSCDQQDFNEFLHFTFNQMKVFVLETAFMEQINCSAKLFLPNIPNGFNTNTLSKKQFNKLLTDFDYKPRPQTANSRLFSNMELCIIMHLYAAVASSGFDWCIIGYEADGVLVAALGDLSKIEKELVQVQALFKDLLQCLTTADHQLDIKNFI